MAAHDLDLTGPDDAARLAEQHGLRLMGVRPPLGDYLTRMWGRRDFVIELARAREQSESAGSRLGQLWRLLNPMLNIAVYFLIFGVLLKVDRSVEDYLSFLVIGVFVFGFTQGSALSGSRAITHNMGLVRALHFPRALLPLAAVLEELLTLLTALLLCFVVVLVQGERPTLLWLLLPVAILLQTMFNYGLALALARFTENVRDISMLLPFLLRTWLYLSGVVFPVQQVAAEYGGIVALIIRANPGAVYIELARDCLMSSYEAPPGTWAWGVGWAVVALCAGLLFFWRAESRYGRG